MHKYLLTTAIVTASFLGAGAHATTLRSGANFSADSSNDSRGYTCGSFSFSGNATSCSGTRYYFDTTNDLYSGYDYEAQAEATASSLKTRTSLSNRVPVELSFSEDNYNFEDDPMPSRYRFADTGEALDDSFSGNYVEFDFDVPPVGQAVFDHVFTEENNFYQSFADASIRDTITVFGGADGETGQIKLSFNLDGTNSSETVSVTEGLTTTFVNASSALQLSIYETGVIETSGGTTIIGRVTQGTTINKIANETIDEFVDLYLDIEFGRAFDLNVLMSSRSDIFNDFGALIPQFATSSEFYSTATLSGISVLDSTGVGIDFFLDSASGETSFEQFSTLSGPPSNPSPVPLPAAAWMLLTSVLALFGSRKLSQRRRQVLV